ncbi:MAG: hypothetical protein WED07_00475 [Candidatus Freyarchaeum deiterrae]
MDKGHRLIWSKDRGVIHATLYIRLSHPSEPAKNYSILSFYGSLKKIEVENPDDLKSFTEPPKSETEITTIFDYHIEVERAGPTLKVRIKEGKIPLSQSQRHRIPGISDDLYRFSVDEDWYG